MKYFVNYPYTAETLKNEYREFCKKLHPDTGGNAQDFAEMMNEYEQTRRNLNGNGTTAHTAHTTAQDDTTAQDFADLMGAPLKGTKGKTFADLVAELSDIFTHDDRRKLYESEGETWGAYGWDGCPMTPESRTAYIKKFGRTVVEMAELCAQMKQAADARAYEQTQHAAHVREARKNQSDTPKAGAFVFGIYSGLKSDGGRGVFENFDAFAWNPETITEHEHDERRNLCKVVEVFEVSAEDFARPELADELVQRFAAEGREFPGGSATDDPEPADDPRDPYAKYKYYYTKVAAVVCRESGRWYLIDAEGYSYARYCRMPQNWRTMYAQEVREAQDRHAARMEQERQEEERKAAEKLAQYREKCAKYEGAGLEDLTAYREAVKTANHEESEAGRAHGWRSPERKAAQRKSTAARAALMAAEKRNIKKMAETVYPGIKCKVTKADSWRSAGYRLTYEDGPTLEEFQNNTDFDLFAAYWEEYRMDDCTEIHRHDLTEFADKYGDGRGVEIAREMSKAERERLTAAILEAVPAAAGICWENRHQWTQDEVKQAAAACGVDGWDLWRAYDHKHTYFNYIDAETLAEWAHELTAYDIKGKSRKATTTATTTAQEGTQQADTTNESTEADTLEQAAEISDTPTTAPAADPDAETGRAPECLRLEEIPGGVAVVGTADNEKARGRQTYKHRKAIRANGATWNREANRWEATDPAKVANLRAWFAMQSDEQAAAAFEAQDEPQADTLENGQDITDTANEPQADQSAGLSPLMEAVADVLRIFADIMQQAKQWEGVTIPAATLQRWKQEANEGTKTAAARLCEVCACLASLTPDSRRDFDALGAIFWSLSEQIRNGYNPDTLQGATDYARAQLFDLIERTQTKNQARAIREANEPDSEHRAAA